jgi:hypothetical protein
MAVNILLRRGTAAEWTASNPILIEGEVGVETDSKKLKVGDGLTVWASLPYITLTPTAAASLYATINNPNFTGTVSLGTGVGILFEGATANDFETALQVVDPTADRTLSLPDATGTLATQEYVASEISTHNSDTTSVHGITDTAELATKTYADSAVSTHNSDTTSIHGIADTAELATKTYADNAATNAAASAVSSSLSEHASDTTSVHGITDTAELATKTYADTAVSTHSSDTTSVHGIADTADLATKSYADSAVSTHGSDTTSIHGIADTAELATKTYADTAVSTHSSDTTDVHGITDTAQLSTKTYADTAVSTHSSDTTEVHGIADTSILVTTTGTQTLTNKTITTPAGLVKSDVGLGNVDNTTDANKPVSTATQSALDLKAPLANPTFTGTVTLPANTISQSMMSDDSVGTNEIGGLAVTTGKIADLAVTEGKIADSAVTSAKIADGTIVNADINASAAIAQSKVADLTTDLAAKLALAGGTMTGALTLSADPSASLHAATKQYVDNTASGVIAKPQVLGATTANIDATYSNGTAGVGATLTRNTNGVFPAESGGASGWAVGKGILVKNQTNKAQNGRYYVSDMGSVSTPYVLTRCTYCDEASEIPGAYIFVQDGTLAGTGWIQTVADPATFVVGTDDIDVFQFSGSGTITAGTGITVSGNEVSISTGAITSSLILDGTIVDGDINASAAIAQSKISGLTADLGDKAPLASPTFTGTVTVAASGVAFTDGTQTKEGVPSRTPIVQKTASYTLSTLTHRDSMIEVDSTSGTTISIPTDATLNYPIGTTIDVLQTNTGQVTIAAVTPETTTVNATPGLKLRTRWSSCTLMKRAANTWVVFGDLTA